MEQATAGCSYCPLLGHAIICCRRVLGACAVRHGLVRVYRRHSFGQARARRERGTRGSFIQPTHSILRVLNCPHHCTICAQMIAVIGHWLHHRNTYNCSVFVAARMRAYMYVVSCALCCEAVCALPAGVSSGVRVCPLPSALSVLCMLATYIPYSLRVYTRIIISNIRIFDQRCEAPSREHPELCF